MKWLTEISLDGLLYVLLGVFWVIAQLAAAAQDRKKRRGNPAAPAGEIGDGEPPSPPESPARTPGERFGGLLKELMGEVNDAVGGEKPGPFTPAPKSGMPPAAKTGGVFPGPAPVSLTNAPAAPVRVGDAPQSPNRLLAPLPSTPFPRQPPTRSFNLPGFSQAHCCNSTAGLDPASLRSARKLREAILLKTLLDPPRALTPPGASSWWNPQGG